MKTIFYDGFGLNEWLFNMIYSLNTPQVNAVWRLISYGYSYWVAGFIALAASIHYLRTRHTASEQQLAALSHIMAVLILSFSLVCCTVYTVQTVTVWPRPWMLYSDTVAVHLPMYWHEGLPATACAIAMMASTILWPYARGAQKVFLALYVVSACLFSIVSGQNWPAEVLYGLIVGALAVRLARLYHQFAIVRIASS